jgi:hypothetical protein
MSLKERLAQTRQKIGDKRAGQQDTYNFKPGKTYLRILPGVEDPSDFYKEFGLHWIKDANGKVITTVGDRGICFGEHDPVREAIEQLRQHYADAGDDVGVKRIKDMLAKTRFIVNAVVTEQPGEAADLTKVQVVEFTENTWDQVLSQLEELLSEGDVDPLDLEKGIVLCVERIGTGLDTKYNVSISPKKRPVSKDVAASAQSLDAFRRSKFGEHQTKAIAALSAMLGRPLSGATMKMLAPQADRAQHYAALSGPSGGSTEAETATTVEEAEFEEIDAPPPAAEPPKKTTAAVTTGKPAAKSVSEEDIFAELESI